MRTDVVALYVDPRGPYPARVVEWFDAARDARTYAGVLPVVAHPPCGPWGRLRHLSKHDDPQHAIDAVATVRRLGGVLEHPAQSKLWEHCGLPRHDQNVTDAWGGFTIQVEQVRWGHVARKTTWLYVVRPTRALPMPPPREPTHWASGSRSAPRGPVPPGIKICSAQQRRRTPSPFADWLLEIAASCQSGERESYVYSAMSERETIIPE